MPVLHTVSVKKKKIHIHHNNCKTFLKVNLEDLLSQFRLVEKLQQNQHLIAVVCKYTRSMSWSGHPDCQRSPLSLEYKLKQSCPLLDAPNRSSTSWWHSPDKSIRANMSGKVDSPQATLASGSCFRWASRTASLIWSQILSVETQTIAKRGIEVHEDWKVKGGIFMSLCLFKVRKVTQSSWQAIKKDSLFFLSSTHLVARNCQSPNSCPKYINQWFFCLFFFFYLKSFTACHTIYYLDNQVLLNSAAVFPDYWLSTGDFERRHVCYGTIAAGQGRRVGERRAECILTFIIHYASGLHNRRDIPRLIAFPVLPKKNRGRVYLGQCGADPCQATCPTGSSGFSRENCTTVHCLQNFCFAGLEQRRPESAPGRGHRWKL